MRRTKPLRSFYVEVGTYAPSPGIRLNAQGETFFLARAALSHGLSLDQPPERGVEPQDVRLVTP